MNDTDTSEDAGGGTAGSSGPLEANLAALKAWAPSLHGQLARFGAAHSELVVEPDGSLDIAFMGQRFYGGDAVAHTEAQVTEFFKDPVRNVLYEPDPQSLEGGIGEFCARVTKRMAEAGIAYDPKRNPPEAHFLLVMGVGLGLHLPALIERSRCRCLILVEPTLENLYHSLKVLDWAALLEAAGERGMEITFITDRDPTTIVLKALATVRANNPILFDGLYLFTHYASAILQQAKERLQREIYSTVRGLGFFEDEARMTANTVDNVARPEVVFVDRPLPQQEAALFIVGSGPSLEKDLAFLKANAGRAMIMSIGTTLRIVLENGIRPDFHIELENGVNNARSIESTAAEFDVSGITLVAAASVVRRMADCFQRVVYFLREENSGTYLVGQPIKALSPSGPTVANTALMAALRFGFREIYLFGVDMGTHQEGRYHAKGSVFSQGVLPEFRKVDKRFAGNFGGEVWGEAVLNWSRQYLEVVLRMFPSVLVYNCSDGVRIDGAIPKVSRAIELKGATLDRPELMARFDATMTRLDGERLAAGSRSLIQDVRSNDIFDRVLAILEPAAKKKDQSDVAWLHEVFRLLRTEAEARSLAASYISGSMQMILGCANWYDRRVVDEARHGECRRIALEEAVVALKAYRSQLMQLFDKADAKLQEQQPGSAVPAV